MIRKDFELIARALAWSRPSHDNADTLQAFVQWQQTVNSFCGSLASANPRFDQNKFVAACKEGQSRV